jgi:cytochrome c-type biogenesis protein
MEVPLALAFTAGLVATLNPCGFAMLPAYLSYFLGLDAEGDAATPATAGHALRVGTVVSAGFLVVFGVAGVLLTIGIQATVRALPWAAMIVGLGITTLGLAMLAGHQPRIAVRGVGRTAGRQGDAGAFAFGVSYAVASLSCTLPVFLAVVAGTIPQLGIVAGVATFLVYGLGMSALLLVVTFALAGGKQALVRRLRRGSRHVGRVSGAVLVLAGAYIVVFWVSTLAGDGTSPLAVVTGVERLSSLVTTWVSRWWLAIGLVAAAVTLGATVIARRRRHTVPSGAPEEEQRAGAARP